MGRLCSRGNVPRSVQDKRLEQSFLQIYYQYKRQDIGPDSGFIHSIPAETTLGNLVWELFPKIGKQLKDWWWRWQHPWEKVKVSTVLPHLLYGSEKLVWFLLFWVKLILCYYWFCFLWVTFPYMLRVRVKCSHRVRRAVLTMCAVIPTSHRQMTMNRKMQSITPVLSSQPSSCACMGKPSIHIHV